MAKFFVGQRVKLVNSMRDPRNDGREAKVVSHEFHPKGTMTAFGPLLADTDYIVTCSDNGERLSVAEWQLEPATDSYDVTTWDSCVWRPEHLRVGV